MIDVSVVVCTYNRSASLRETLMSLCVQRSSCQFEIIVVDNNSNDGTKSAVEEFMRRKDHKVRYFFEPRQGISFARNAGIRMAKGKIIAFTDDDVIVDTRWVQALWRCFEETGAMAVGGKIERLWHCEHPEWLAEEIMGPLIWQDYGSQRTRWPWPNRHLVGANVSFQRTVFDRHGLFREELGRKGDRLIGGEDRELFQRLMNAGDAIFYEPQAVVAHKVEAERLSKPYLRRWFWEVGKTLGHQIDWRWHYAFLIAPFWLWRAWLVAIFRYALASWRAGMNAARHFASEIWVRHYGAMLWERLIHWLPFGLGENWCAFHFHQRRIES